MARNSVLVVDDHDSGRFAKVRVLRRAGFEVLEAATGAEALRLIESGLPDAVVLDVNLPDINGLEVSRRVRAAEGEMATIPILQISSTAVSSADQVQGLDYGADVYVTEPIDPEVLVAAIRSLVRARHAERELAAALQRERAARLIAEEANATKNDFIATLSHELRTPLNSLLGSVWQLRHTALDEGARMRALDRIQRSAAAQARLINDLLDLSRVSRGKLTLSLQLTNVRPLLEDCVDAIKAAASQKGLTIETALHDVWVIVDPDRLQQVIVNLLTNAVQFTPQDGRIAINTIEEGDDLVIRVDDSGAGIDAEFLPLVFEQFRQGEAGMSRKHGGLGLGLAVVKQLVELHGAEVLVSSGGKGRGSSFCVRVPIEREVGGEPKPSALALDGLTLLLVDGDLPSDLPVTLAAAGAVVDTVHGVDEVRRRLKESAYDAVVLSPSVRPAPIAEAIADVGDRGGRWPILAPTQPSEPPAALVRRLNRGVRART